MPVHPAELTPIQMLTVLVLYYDEDMRCAAFRFEHTQYTANPNTEK